MLEGDDCMSRRKYGGVKMKNISKAAIAILILGMTFLFCNYDAHVFALQTKNMTSNTQAETSNKESSAVIGDVFTANIIHNGKQNLPCVFKVLTAPTEGNSGTVQVGDGISSAIDKETSGAIDYSIEIQDGNGNKFEVVSVGKNAFTGCDSLDNAKDEKKASALKKNEGTIQEKKKIKASNATVTANIVNDGLIKSKKASRRNLVKGDSFTANIVHNGIQDLPCEFVVDEPSSGVGIMGTVKIGGGSGPAIEKKTNGTIELPDVVTDSSGVKYSVIALNSNAFYGCDRLTSTGLATNNSITEIGDNAFNYCTKLTTTGLEKNNKVKFIDGYAFMNCTYLTDTGLSKNTSVTNISDYVFDTCISLTTTGLGRNTTVTQLGNCVFGDCPGINEDVFVQINFPTTGIKLFNMSNNYRPVADIYYVADMKNPESLIASAAKSVQKLDVNSIKIKTAPKNVYIEGESFDPTGLEIEVTYDKNITVVRKYDDTTKGNFSFNKTTISSGVTEVVVTYLGKSTIQPISVIDPFFEVNLLNDNDDSVIKKFGCLSLDELEKMMVNKGVYDIKILKDMVMDEASKNKLKDILDKKTTRYYLGGSDRFTPTLTFDSDWSLGGNNSTKGNVIRNIKIKASKDMTIFANSNHTVIGDKVVVEGNAAIFAGINSPTQEIVSETSNLSVTSGTWIRIGGGGVNNTIKGDVHLSVGGDAIVSNQVGMSKSKMGSSIGMAGANTLPSEHVGEIKGKAYLDITGNATINGNAYVFSSVPPCGIASVYGANLNGLIVTIDGNAVVNPTAGGWPEFNIGAYSYWGDSAPSNQHVAHYNYGDTDVIVKGDADIQAAILYNGRLSKGQFGLNSKKNQSGNLTYNINKTGAKPVPGIGNLPAGRDIQLGLADGKKVVANIGANSVVSTIQNVDDIVIGEGANSVVSIGSILPNTTNLHPNSKIIDPNLKFKNISTLNILDKSPTINDLVIEGDNSELILNKTTNVSPISIKGIVSGGILGVGVSGNGVTDDLLIQNVSYTTMNQANFKIAKSASAKFSVALALDKQHLYLLENKDTLISGGLENVKYEFAHHIDDIGSSRVSVLAKFHFGFKREGSIKYMLGTQAYISDNKTEDTAWTSKGEAPNGITQLLIKPDGAENELRADEYDLSKLYYLHVRNIYSGVCMQFPIDFNGIHINQTQGDKPYNDEMKTTYSIDLKETTFVKEDPEYIPSGIKEAAFSLNKNNMSHSSYGDFREQDGFYSISKWNTNKAEETYRMEISNDVIHTLKEKNQKEVYVYTKDMAGNTTVSTFYVGDDFVNVVIPTKASVVALAGSENKIITPNLEIVNHGSQKVNIQVGANGYDENASDIKLVKDKVTYNNNEMALELIPNKSNRFTPIYVKDIMADKFHSLGNVDYKNDKIEFKFKAAFSPTIDISLKTTNLKLNYRIIPETTKP